MGTSIWSEVIDTFLNKKDFANGSPLYFDLRNANSERYDIIQNNIANQTKNVYNKLKGLPGDEVSKLIGTLISKRKESINKESALLPSYNGKNYEQMTDDERVELATQVYLGLKKGRTENTGAIIEKNPIIYLGYFFKSNELYNALKANGAGELLSRGVITKKLQDDAFINKETIEKLSEIFGNFQESQDILIEDIYKEVERDIRDMLSNIKEIFIKDYDNFDSKPQRLAKTYSSSTRDKIRNFLDGYNKKHSPKLEGIIVYRHTEKDKTTIKIDLIPLEGTANKNINRQNTLLAVFSSEASKGKNNWYLAFKNRGNENEIISIFTGLVYNALESCNEFNVINVGKISLDDTMKQEMEDLLKPKEISNFIGIRSPELDKMFNPANSNAFLSGFLGELGNYYIIKGKQNNLNLTISGSAYDEIGSGNLKSQSVSDLTVKDKSGENNLYGFNIKNYISMSNNTTITLYKSDNGLDIFNGFMSKYFTEEEVQLARFLVLNAEQNKLDSKNIKLSIGSTALKNLPNFLRITNADPDQSITNLFFILNNICYPTSYIYSQLIEELRNCGRKRESQIDNFFTFSYQSTELPIYEDEGDAERYMEKDNNNNIMAKSLQDPSYINKYKPNNSLYIQFKGLKVNLMSFVNSR